LNPIWFVVFAISSWVSTPQPFQVQFARSEVGRDVVVCIDGQKVERTFAGKLTFRDQNHTWQSVCADVRSPIRHGEIFTVRAFRASKVGGNIALAGNIVAKFFKSAQTPDQCAGLQIAVWKAIEDGTEQADFGSGRFQVRATQSVLAYAQQYYQGIGEPGEAIYIQSSPGQSGLPNEPLKQSQLSTT